MAHSLPLIRATSRPGTVLSASGMLVMPRRRGRLNDHVPVCASVDLDEPAVPLILTTHVAVMDEHRGPTGPLRPPQRGLPLRWCQRSRASSGLGGTRGRTPRRRLRVRLRVTRHRRRACAPTPPAIRFRYGRRAPARMTMPLPSDGRVLTPRLYLPEPGVVARQVRASRLRI